jgi:hypothetical protein
MALKLTIVLMYTPTAKYSYEYVWNGGRRVERKGKDVRVAGKS